MQISTFTQNGIDVCLCETSKFNTVSVCLVQRMPLRRSTATVCSLIPRLISSLPTPGEINARLDELGAQLIATPVKKGEEQIQSYYLTAPRDNTGKLFDFLSNLVYRQAPFKQTDAHRACTALAADIAQKINNKRAYAAERLIEIMCADEPFGVCGDGYIEDIKNIDGEKLYSAYRSLLTSATQLYIVGDISREQTQSYISSHFNTLQTSTPPPPPENNISPHDIKYHSEKGDTAQACLNIGIRIGGDYAELLCANEVLGGGASSELFKSIREDKGLCYYIGSQLYRYKGIIAVSSGIAEQNAERVTELTTRLIRHLAKHRVDLKAAKDRLISAFKAIEDSPSRLLDFMLSLSVAEDELSIEQVNDKIAAVNDVRDIFDTAFIDTVYLLKEGKA